MGLGSRGYPGFGVSVAKLLARLPSSLCSINKWGTKGGNGMKREEMWQKRCTEVGVALVFLEKGEDGRAEMVEKCGLP